MFRASLAVVIAMLAVAVGVANAGAATSPFCRLIPMKELAKPAGAKTLSVRSTSLAQGGATAIVCEFRASGRFVVTTRVLTEPSAAKAQTEFRSEVKNDPTASSHSVHGGAWNDARYIGRKGIIVLRGRRIFNLTYLGTTTHVTRTALRRMAARAVAQI
jgi:hypothetical protein